jgi:NAD-dependent dihydropyrimidine dehydrogenase PreA subunit
MAAHVIAESYIGKSDTTCVDTCPVDCIHPERNTTDDGGRRGFDECHSFRNPGAMLGPRVSRLTRTAGYIETTAVL